MDESLVQHFSAVLRPLLPEKAMVQVIRAANDAAILHIDYQSPLKDRPDRRSAALNLFFPHPTIARYNKNGVHDRAAADRALQVFTKHILEHFEWEHETPGNQPPPAETVFIDDDVLFF